MLALSEQQREVEKILHTCNTYTYRWEGPWLRQGFLSLSDGGEGNTTPEIPCLSGNVRAVDLHSFQISTYYTFKKQYLEKLLSNTTRFAAIRRQSFPLCLLRQERGLLFQEHIQQPESKRKVSASLFIEKTKRLTGRTQSKFSINQGGVLEYKVGSRPGAVQFCWGTERRTAE